MPESNNAIQDYGPVGRTPLNFSPRGTLRNLQQFFDWLNHTVPNNFEIQKSVFFGCARIAHGIPQDSFFIPGNITLPAIATVLLGLKRLVGHRFPLIDEDTTIQETTNPLRPLLVEGEGVYPDRFVEYFHVNNDASFRQALRTLTWTQCSNGQYQGRFMYQISNLLVLTGLAGFGQLQPNPVLVEQLFQDSINVSAMEYFQCLFALWTIGCQGIRFDSQRVYGGLTGNPNFERALRMVVDDLSFRVDEDIANPALSGYSGYSGKTLAEAIFSKKPLIQLTERNYLISGHPFLRIQMTVKFLQKALAFARIREGVPSTRFSQFVAGRLESFFGELCSAWNPIGGIFNEYLYSAQGNEKSPDKIIFEKQTRNDVVTLVQIKTKMLRDETHFGISDGPLEDDVDTAFSEMISKSITYLFNLDIGLRTGTLNPQTAELSRRILAAKKVCLVGLSPFLPPIFSNFVFRQELIQKVQQNVGEEVWSWFTSRYEYKKKWFWHIIDLEEFEVFISSPPEKVNLFDEVSQYICQCAVDNYPFGPDPNPTLPDNFRSFVIKRHPVLLPDSERGRRLDEIPELHSIFERFGDEVVNFLYPNRQT